MSSMEKFYGFFVVVFSSSVLKTKKLNLFDLHEVEGELHLLSYIDIVLISEDMHNHQSKWSQEYGRQP